MNDILHIVGNRPQFIKLAPVVEELNKLGKKQIIIHTGQHYDFNMSDIFFDELNIPSPDENLNIGSGTHAEVTGNAMIALEKTIQKYEPQLVLVYGDTNSTLAGALASRKLNYQLCHIEAGTRSYNKKNPEETNRVIVDHISDVLFCPDKISVQNLANEGITENVFFSGDVMEDVFNRTKASDVGLNIIREKGLKTNQYFLMTWHRQENTDSIESLCNIISLIEEIPKPILCPLHPRTKNILERTGLIKKVLELKNLVCIEPVGYKEMVTLNRNSCGIICDSGGLSKEAYYAGKKCLFMLELNVWPDLFENGWMKQYTPNSDRYLLVEWLLGENVPQKEEDFYGNGVAAQRIVAELAKFL